MDVKKAVKEKYRQAALRVTAGGVRVVAAILPPGALTRSHPVCTMRRRLARFQKKHCWLHSDVEIRPH